MSAQTDPVSSDPLALLAAEWAAADGRAAGDPFTNAYFLFALALNRRMEAGEVAPSEVEAAIQTLSAEAALARAARLHDYLGLDRGDPAQRTQAVFERLADRSADFDAYAGALACPPVGLVTTGHPTFALSEPLSLALVELALGLDAEDRPLDDAGRRARMDDIRQTPHGPPPDLSLDVEHAWSLRALANTTLALDGARRAAIAVARRRWPADWRRLDPRLMTLATWVGFDQDGRSDVTWIISFAKRLELKAAALRRYIAMAEPLAHPPILEPLTGALARVEGQIETLSHATGGAADIARFSRQLIADRDHALTDPAPVLQAIEAALPTADDDQAERLILLKAALGAQGICLAHIHVRLNSTQLHNAIRREVGLDTAPSDPSNRRSYFHAVNALLEDCRPVSASFKSLMAEGSSARRLFMTIAQMVKYVDAASPVRFLIAETESGFTLLAAQYFARLFGLEAVVQLSPLFETEEGLDRGETVVEEALRSPHFRRYLEDQGVLALEFGFSDSGRFIGQMAATFRIERLRLRVAELLEREGLTALRLILFNTHGESMGRGGHPTSLHDRLAYAAPPRDRMEFARRGVRVCEEDSFQGGEGYLPLFIPGAARATVAGLLSFGFDPQPEAEGDPIYDVSSFAAEFFATIQQAFGRLAASQDYATLLSLYGTRLLPKTGSRPDQRQSAESGPVRTFVHVSELRAIPNNAILQGLGNLVNVTFGIERAAAKDPETFDRMRRASARFRRAMALAATAAGLSDHQAMRAYAATVNPSLWLDRIGGDNAGQAVLLDLAELAHRAAITGHISDVLREIRMEPSIGPAVGPGDVGERRVRIRLLHALRIALIQRLCVLGARIPEFTPRNGVSREDVVMQLMRLDAPAALKTLKAAFPLRPDPAIDEAEFGEAATYRPAESIGYRHEHDTLIEPIEAIHRLLVRSTAAIGHECGAMG